MGAVVPMVRASSEFSSLLVVTVEKERKGMCNKVVQTRVSATIFRLLCESCSSKGSLQQPFALSVQNKTNVQRYQIYQEKNIPSAPE